MQSMLASLVVQLGVRDAAYKSGMSAARAEAKRTGQDFEKSANTIGGAMERAALTANRAMVAMVDGMSAASRKAMGVGVALTAALTVPLGMAAKSSKDTAADFQASMNNVRAAMMSTSPDQIDKLRQAAMQMGPEVGRSAIEAADGIEMLAKNGLAASTILGGALQSTLVMAAANQAGLSESADLTTDVMSQFGKTASELPMVVDRVTGALDASKLNFQDYALAIGQAGGVAGGLGYDFEEFNAALAASIPLFTSGSDAGTSFKTFLTSLTPASKEAKEMMEQLGLEFFNADGSAKSLTEVAGILRKQLGNLSDSSLNNVLQTIFGRDAMRTAISLMQQGADGLGRMEASIASIKAQDKLDIIMEGDIKASERLSASWTNLKIQMGSVLIPIFTAVKNALAAIVDALASAPPWFYQVAVTIQMLVASIGPMILALMTVTKVVLPLMLGQWIATNTVLGRVALAFMGLVNPIGFVVRLLGALAVNLGAAKALGILGARAVALAGPIGIIISLMMILVPLLTRGGEASDYFKKRQDEATEGSKKATDVLTKLAAATGKARIETLALAKAERLRAYIQMQTARNDLTKARQSRQAAKRDLDESLSASPLELMTNRAGVAARVGGARARITKAEANMTSATEALTKFADTAMRMHEGIRAAEIEIAGGLDEFGGAGDAAKTGSAGRGGSVGARDQQQEQDNVRFAADLRQLKLEELQAHADLTDSSLARYRLAMAQLAHDRASFEDNIRLDDALDQPKRDQLLAAYEIAETARKEVINRQRHNDLIEEDYELLRDRNGAEQDMVRASLDMADSMAARRAGELRLLALQKEEEKAALERALNRYGTSTPEWQTAFNQMGRLDGKYDAKARAVMRDTEGPMAGYLRSASMSADALRESLQGVAVDGMVMLNDALAAGAFNARGFGQAMLDMAKSSVTALLRIGYQMMVIKPLAESLFGSTGWLSGLMGGSSLAGQAAGSIKAQGFTASQWAFGGARALGGRVEPGHFYTVGERGPETFYADRAGTIAPASAGGGRKVAVTVDASPLFKVTMREEAMGAASETVGAHQQRAARRAGRRLGGR